MDPFILIPILTIAGFLLIVIDLLFIPGGILIIVGSGGILYSIFLTWQNYGLMPTVFHTLVCLAIVPKLITKSLDRVALKDEMHAEDGYVGLTSRADYIGKQGTALSDLRPSGSVRVEMDGLPKRLDCIAEGGYIEKGETVQITEERGPSLVVKKIQG